MSSFVTDYSYESAVDSSSLDRRIALMGIEDSIPLSTTQDPVDFLSVSILKDRLWRIKFYSIPFVFALSTSLLPVFFSIDLVNKEYSLFPPQKILAALHLLTILLIFLIIQTSASIVIAKGILKRRIKEEEDTPLVALNMNFLVQDLQLVSRMVLLVSIMIWVCFIVAVASTLVVAMELSFFPFGSPSIFEEISKDTSVGHRVELELGLLSCFLFISAMVPMGVFVYLSKWVKETRTFSFQESPEEDMVGKPLTV